MFERVSVAMRHSTAGLKQSYLKNTRFPSSLIHVPDQCCQRWSGHWNTTDVLDASAVLNQLSSRDATRSAFVCPTKRVQPRILPPLHRLAHQHNVCHARTHSRAPLFALFASSKTHKSN